MKKSHTVHYWILHKDGYHFCACGARKDMEKP